MCTCLCPLHCALVDNRVHYIIAMLDRYLVNYVYCNHIVYATYVYHSTRIQLIVFICLSSISCLKSRDTY
jgi:hypothetical protein